VSDLESSPREDGADEFGRRAVLQRILVAWLFGAAWQSITTGATLTRYAKSLHVSELGFGVLAAIPFIAAFAQLPASYLIHRHGHRKRVYMTANLIHRSLWLVIAAIPWLLPAGACPFGLITLMLISALANHTTAPAWYSWLSDIVPPRLRGRYLSRRTQAGQIVSLVLTVAVGLSLDWAEGISGVALSRVLSLLLAIAAVFGLTDILMFARIPDRSGPEPDRQYGVRHLFVEPLRNRSFRRYLGFTAALTFSIGYVGQFSWLYVFDVVGLSNTRANLVLVTLPLMVALFAVPFWGRMIDRLGRKPVALIATACVVHGGIIWVVIRNGSLMPAYLGVLVAAFAWPGVELASYNIMLGLIRQHRNAGQNTAYVALNSVVVAASGAASGLFGGLLASRLKNWHGDFFGLPMTYHCILFAMSAGFRILAVWSLRGIDDPRAFSARQAMEFMAVDMYSNLQAAVTAPLRLAGSWRYRVKK